MREVHEMARPKPKTIRKIKKTKEPRNPWAEKRRQEKRPFRANSENFK
jgi:hypothetical protein